MEAQPVGREPLANRRKTVTRKLHLPDIEPEDLSYGTPSPFSLFRRSPLRSKGFKKERVEVEA